MVLLCASMVLSGDVKPFRILVLCRMYKAANSARTLDLYDSDGSEGVDLQQVRFAGTHLNPTFMMFDTCTISSGVWVVQEDFDVPGRFWIIRKKGRLEGSWKDVERIAKQTPEMEEEEKEKERERREEEDEIRKQVNRRMMGDKEVRDERAREKEVIKRAKDRKRKERNRELMDQYAAGGRGKGKRSNRK